MHNPSAKVLQAAFKMLEAGKTQKEILATTWNQDGKKDPNGETLNYSQFWLYCQSQTLPAEAFITATEGSEDWFKAVAKCRTAGDSWGLIAVKCRAPEGRIRKAFTEATGLKSQGLRIGRGGRYLSNDPVLYTGEAVKTGTAIPKEAKRTEYRDFVTAGLEALPDAELARRATLHGFKVSGRTKRALLLAMVQNPAGVKAAQEARMAAKAAKPAPAEA